MNPLATALLLACLASRAGAALPAQEGPVLLVPGDTALVQERQEAVDVDDPDPAGLNEVRLARNASSPLADWLPKDWSADLSGLTQHINAHVLLVPVVIGFALLVLMASSMANWRWKTEEKRMHSQDPAPIVVDGAEAPPGGPAAPAASELRNWSVAGIVALTSYRFYTGFLSATWMPYLLAMEGHQLMGGRQSFFMGSAKLIYGLSIMMNPMFGLVGDQMAVISHWSGRKLFVIMGVAAGGLGIYGCVVAAEIGSVWWYLAATVLWMLGEAMADVTTETLVPELLPKSQYEVASAIRALNFLLGGLVGYAALIVFRHLHYSWLYYGYLLVMLVCAFLTLCFIQPDDLRDRPEGAAPRQRGETSLATLVAQAYVLPARLEGGFPMACSCLFIFSLGSAPMFFLLLMVRDVIGIKEHVEMQMHFSIISIVFFVSAAAASVLGVLLDGEKKKDDGASAAAEGDKEANAVAVEEDSVRNGMVLRWRLMVVSTVVFGAVAAAIPMVGVLPTLFTRKAAFYFVAVFFGLSFGSVYARFQECTWSLLPKGVEVANAMGFAAMCKLAGVGIGNFFAGIILDMFSPGEAEQTSYSLGGYLIMCFFCSAVVLLSARVAWQVSQIALANYDSKLGAETS